MASLRRTHADPRLDDLPLLTTLESRITLIRAWTASRPRIAFIAAFVAWMMPTPSEAEGAQRIEGLARNAGCRSHLDDVQRQVSASSFCRYEYECRQIAIGRLEKMQLDCDALPELDRTIWVQKAALREMARELRDKGIARLAGGAVRLRAECESTRKLLSRATRVDPFDEETSFLLDLTYFDCYGFPLSWLLFSETAAERWRDRHVQALAIGLPPIDLPLMAQVEHRAHWLEEH